MKNTRMLRVLSLVIALMVLVCSLPVTAAEPQRKLLVVAGPEPANYNSSESDTLIAKSVDLEAFSAYIAAQMAECPAEIDISEFNIPLANIQELFNYIWYYIPECYHFETSSVLPDGNGIMSSLVEISYYTFSDTAEEYETGWDIISTTAEALTADIADDESLSDVEKALLLHDRLAVWNEYDNSLSLGPSHSLYGALVDGTSVCEGYAKAYIYLLGLVGIESEYCASTSMNHAWNIVYIDGVPYHVDVTWDDAVPDISGRVNHNYFLLSSSELMATRNNGATDFDQTPNSTAYDDAFWRGTIESAVQLIDGSFYCIYDEDAEDSVDPALARVDIGEGSVESLVSIEDHWDADGGYWPGSYARTATAGGDLLYNTPDAVYRYDPATDESTAVCTLGEDIDSDGEYYRIYGMNYLNGFIVCDTNDSPNFDSETRELHQKTFAYEPVSDGSGDDGDGETFFFVQTVADKYYYYENEPLDYENYYLEIHKNESEEIETVPLAPEMVSGFTTENVGKYAFEVNYQGMTSGMGYNVKHEWVEQENGIFRCAHCGETRDADNLWSYMDSIEVATKGKDVYNEGDVFDFEGWTLCCWYDDGSSFNIDATPDLLADYQEELLLPAAGSQFIDLTYEGCDTTLDVTVNHTFEAPSGALNNKQKCTYCGATSLYVTGVECVSEPSRTYYLEDEVFANGPVDFDGLSVKVSYKGAFNVDRTFDFTEGTKFYTDSLFMNAISRAGEDVFWTGDFALEPNYAFFDCEDNGDGTYDIYINTLGSRNLVTTVTYEHSNVTGIAIDHLVERNSTLEEMIGSVFTITYANGSSEEITVSEDNICNHFTYYESGYYNSEEHDLSDKGSQALKIGDNYAVLHYDEGKMSYMGHECDVYIVRDKIELSEESKYQDDGTYITMNQPADMDSFYENLGYTFYVYDTYLLTPEGEDYFGETVGTGLKLTMFRYSEDSEPTVLDSRTVILPGDCSGDGVIDVVDVKLALNTSLNKDPLTGVYRMASNVNNDEVVDVVDIKLILNVSLGKQKSFA